MKAIYLTQHGPASSAFEVREVAEPLVAPGQVRIVVEAFGLNFADVMARLGLYPSAPAPPCVLGYDVVGRIEAVGEGVDESRIGQRVTALTRFGGYAEVAVTDARGAVEIPDEMDTGVALALATQATTAYYMAEEMVRLHPGDHVLVHAAAGGVGTCLVQLAKHRGCVVFGTAGSPAKLNYLLKQGVDHPINYRQQDFVKAIRAKVGQRGLDVIFDPLGGKSVRQGMKLLGSTGRMLAFGGSSFLHNPSRWGKLRNFLSYGFYHPLRLVALSKALIGVNMLAVGDHRPDVLQRAMSQTVLLAQKGILRPTVRGIYQTHQFAEAHHALESRQIIGKAIVKW